MIVSDMPKVHKSVRICELNIPHVVSGHLGRYTRRSNPTVRWCAFPYHNGHLGGVVMKTNHHGQYNVQWFTIAILWGND